MITHQRRIIHQSCTKKFETATTNCVRAGSSLPAFSKLAVIFGTINIIINTTMIVVILKRITGYIMAPFTFHFSSILSRRFLSNSAKIFPSCPVFSHTHMRAVVRESKTLGY